jgi:hypothetical protein
MFNTLFSFITKLPVIVSQECFFKKYFSDHADKRFSATVNSFVFVSAKRSAFLDSDDAHSLTSDC